jgi:hypothetical protein
MCFLLLMYVLVSVKVCTFSVTLFVCCYYMQLLVLMSFVNVVIYAFSVTKCVC